MAATYDTFKQFETYPWESDERFQQGLKSIAEDADAKEQAKFFYFSRFVQPIDRNGYLAWIKKQTAVPSAISLPTEDGSARTSTEEESEPGSGPGDDAAQYPRSFQEICEMVAKGELVPGIKQIPDTLNEQAPSASALNPRKKPWES
ncbi:hypothetical protein HKX48_003849 [Thoreauomyces humboldtii]|nr:hypothetical protein HKX48_003849 [Thoreauomyces humboldtii]